jgi:hypothetical protein
MSKSPKPTWQPIDQGQLI